ncbi:MAG: hypothetical protein Kow00107_09700 [Planctomycetota bacterium]
MSSSAHQKPVRYVRNTLFDGLFITAESGLLSSEGGRLGNTDLSGGTPVPHKFKKLGFCNAGVVPVFDGSGWSFRSVGGEGLPGGPFDYAVAFVDGTEDSQEMKKHWKTHFAETAQADK